jgi:hypothetical protein
LHAATACATPAALGALEDGVEVVAGVVEVAVVEAVLALAALVVVVAGVLVEVEFELLPQPASSAPASSASRSGNRVAIIGPPMGSVEHARVCA